MRHALARLNRRQQDNKGKKGEASSRHFPAATSISACRFGPGCPSSNIPPIVALRKPLAEAVHKPAECAIRKAADGEVQSVLRQGADLLPARVP